MPGADRERVDRVLRATIVAQWLLIPVAIGVMLAGAGSLPPELQKYAWGEGDLPAGWVLALSLGGSAVWAISTIGVWLRWRPARSLYAISVALGIATQPAWGPQVLDGWTGTINSVAFLLLGATLALLYFSPAAQAFGGALRVGPAVPASTPPRGSLLAGLIFSLLGALALIGVAATLLVGWAVLEMGRVDAAEDEGRAFGPQRTDAACLAEARRRSGEEAVGWRPFTVAPMFLDGCLEKAPATDGFCRDVPPPYDKATDAFVARSCGEEPACSSLMLEVQEHCHKVDPDSDLD